MCVGSISQACQINRGRWLASDEKKNGGQRARAGRKYVRTGIQSPNVILVVVLARFGWRARVSTKDR